MAKANHRKFDLLDHIVQAVNDSGWSVIYVSDINEHPFRLKIYNDEESHQIKVYIWNLTHGGGFRRPADEYRIQITPRTLTRFTQNADEKTLLLGWWDGVNVFAGYDFNKHNGPLGASPSIQIKEKNLRQAAINGFSAYDRENGEIAIAFQPDFFVDYVRNLHQLHAMGDVAQDLRIVEEVVTGMVEINAEVLSHVSSPRQTTVEMISKKLRDNSFKKRVLNAYGNRCAFSGMQLKLVDAAHILPVAAAGSTDETKNGIALSALYHRAFDKGLVTINSSYQTVINEDKINGLAAMRLDAGVDNFRDNLLPVIHLPPAINDRPLVHFIEEANRLRGWTFNSDRTL